MPVLLCSFALFFWGAMDTIVHNQDVIAINPRDAFFPLLVAFFVATTLCTSVLIILRGALLDSIVSVILSLAVAGWIQIMFLNRNIGLIDGDELYFTTWQIISNIAIWVIVLVIVFATRWFFKNKWTKSVIYISALLFLMQFIAFVSVIPSILDSERRLFNTGHFLSMEYEFMMSNNENTLVFVLDAMSVDRLNTALNAFPNLRETFQDFTSFENSATYYDGTFPSMGLILTNQHFDFSRPTREYLEELWTHPETLDFYDALNEAGYRFHLFTTTRDISLDISQIEGIADNLVYGEMGEIITSALVREMINLSAFRHAPFILKSRLVPYDGSFYTVVREFRGYSFSVMNDILLYQRLITNGLWAQDDCNIFLVNHMRGSHTGGGAGANMDEFANHRPEGTEQYQQTAGALWIVGEFINQMKQLGIYDNSNILIMADHGAALWPDSAFLIKRAGERHEYMQTSQAPISHTDLWPTLVDIMGLDNLDFGRSVFDIPEDEERERTLMSWIWYENFENTHHTYNAIASLTFTEHVLDVAPHIVQGRRRQGSGFAERFPHIQLHPIYDSFYGGGWTR